MPRQVKNCNLIRAKILFIALIFLSYFSYFTSFPVFIYHLLMKLKDYNLLKYSTGCDCRAYNFFISYYITKFIIIFTKDSKGNTFKLKCFIKFSFQQKFSSKNGQKIHDIYENVFWKIMKKKGFVFVQAGHCNKSQVS